MLSATNVTPPPDFGKMFRKMLAKMRRRKTATGGQAVLKKYVMDAEDELRISRGQNVDSHASTAVLVHTEQRTADADARFLAVQIRQSLRARPSIRRTGYQCTTPVSKRQSLRKSSLRVATDQKRAWLADHSVPHRGRLVPQHSRHRYIGQTK